MKARWALVRVNVESIEVARKECPFLVEEVVVEGVSVCSLIGRKWTCRELGAVKPRDIAEQSQGYLSFLVKSFRLIYGFEGLSAMRFS